MLGLDASKALEMIAPAVKNYVSEWFVKGRRTPEGTAVDAQERWECRRRNGVIRTLGNIPKLWPINTIFFGVPTLTAESREPDRT